MADAAGAGDADAGSQARARFMAQVVAAIGQRRLRRLLLSRPATRQLAPGFEQDGPVLQRVVVRPVQVRDGVRLGFVWHYDTRDMTDTLDMKEGVARIGDLLTRMRSALLDGGTHEAELGYSKRGRPLFRSRRLPGQIAAGAGAPAGAAAPVVSGEPTLAGRAAAGRDGGPDMATGGPGPIGPSAAGGSRGIGNTDKAVIAGDEITAGHAGDALAAGGAGHGAPGRGRGLADLRPVGDHVIQNDECNIGGGSGQELAHHASTGNAAGEDGTGGWLGLISHNRARQYRIALDRPFLVDLGIVSPAGRLVGAMARKWRQINRFVEIVTAAWQNNPQSATLGRPGQAPVRIRDYGAGKGYLTFALHDHLTHGLGLRVETVGIERRSDLVRQGNGIASRLGLTGLRFRQGDIAGCDDDEAADWVIALHACDTATDDALYRGVRQQALMMVCSPCCHRELRPQVQVPAVLGPLLRHGIHLGQEAEMLTDSLRALLLEGQGYEARVFEFIGLEDTGKNRMILANRTGRRRAGDKVQAELQALAGFYGIRQQRLAQLLDVPLG